MMPNQQKRQRNILEDVLDHFLDHPLRLISVVILIGIFFGYWKWDVLLTSLSISEDVLHYWLKTIQRFVFYFLILAAVLMVLRKIFYVLRIQKSYEYVHILPHADDGVSAEDLSNLMRRIHGSKRKILERLFLGREWYSFVIYRSSPEEGAGYNFYLGAESSQLETLKANFKSVYGRMQFFDVEDLPIPSKKAVGGRLKLRNNSLKKSLPLRRYRSDQLSGILSTMENETWVQVAFSPNDGWRLRKGILKLEEEIKGDRKASDQSSFEKEELNSLKHRFSGNEVAFDCTVSMATEHYPGVRIIKNVGNTISSIANDTNELRYKKLKRSVQWFPTNKPYRMVWTGSELANLIHMPNFKSDHMKSLSKLIAHAGKGTELLPANVLSSPEGITFGYQYHPFVKNREVKVSPDVLGKHWLLTGLNGSGKSTLINAVLKSFIDGFIANGKGPGFSFVDPAIETALVLLNQICKAELDGKEIDWSKVHWVSFKNTDYPPAMNLLHRMEGESAEFVTDIVMRIIRENFSVAPQAERLLRNCIKTLVIDPDETHTILGVKQLINDEVFRMRVVSRLSKVPEAYDLVDFWNFEAPDLIELSRIPLFNRLDIFTSNDLFRRMFGQKEFAFPVRKWMDEGHFIFFDFSGMGEQEISLIGSNLTYLFYRVAEQRPGRPLLHQLTVDEAAKVKASIFPYIVREMRKKGLSAGIATQSIKDLPDDLQKAMTNVQGNFFVCRQGQDDAKVTTPFFRTKESNQPIYSESFLQSLPDRVAVVRTQDNIDGVDQTVTCLVEVPPLDRYLPDGTVANYRREDEVAAANAWTLEKAKELSSQNGFHYSEIDLIIKAYLKGEEYVPQKRKESPRKLKAPITKQPETPLHLMRTKKIHEEQMETEAETIPLTLQKKEDTKQLNNQKEHKTEERRPKIEGETENQNFSTGSILQRMKAKADDQKEE
ncbi:hypothetical protein [Bacillus amyloliquefaciens]|uniref:hypothetical protein n=1 Tax=Bacillus amyloliquefaciens TaxID=1390 RepID=UPI002807C9E2|nr:hypothetical protein [Bacillus amyloliquefaciens]MDQ8094860.1 hypothetical protein [Bacillus amyloliquefaciens]